MEISKLFLKIVFFIILLSLNEGYSQNENEEKAKICYLIGLINSSEGYSYIPHSPEKSSLITYFYSGQKIALDSFKIGLKRTKLNLDYFNFETEKNIDNPPTKVYSIKYLDTFHSFFRFKKLDAIYTNDEDDEFNIFLGKLKTSEFKTREQKLQFIKGAYIRNKVKMNKGIYKMIYSGDPSVKKLLKATGSKIISLKKNSTLIGGHPYIIFEPSEDLNILIDPYDN